MIRAQLSALVACLTAFATASPSYYEAMFTLPGTNSPKSIANVKCRIWVEATYSRVDIGDRLVLLVDESPAQMVVLDRVTQQSVTVTADPKDETAIATLHDWEAAIFPLLPGHAGPDGNWSAFERRLEALSAPSTASGLVIGKSKKPDDIAYASYDLKGTGLSGRVSWGFLNGQDPSMITWSFQPVSERMRSMRIGQGVIGGGHDTVEYGYAGDSGPATPLPSSAELHQASFMLTSGGIAGMSGFLRTPDQAVDWLLNRTAYRITD